MKLEHLLAQSRQFPIFTVADCQKWFPDSGHATLLLQLANYTTSGRLLRLRRGLYLLNNDPTPDPLVIASSLKPECVISMETVLSRCGLIPETALAVVALTGGRNTNYSFPQLGSFIFQHLDPHLLFGWQFEQFPPYLARVARPEKALLDLLWFHRQEKDPLAYVRELRLSIPDSFSWSSFQKMARDFNQPRIIALARLIEHEYRH